MTPLAKDLRQIILIWLALMVLLALTIFLAFIPLGAGNTIVSLFIAGIKTGLVAAFYMHLRTAIVYLRLAAMVALGLASMLFIIVAVDYLTRVAPPAPWQ